MITKKKKTAIEMITIRPQTESIHDPPPNKDKNLTQQHSD